MGNVRKKTRVIVLYKTRVRRFAGEETNRGREFAAKRKERRTENIPEKKVPE